MSHKCPRRDENSGPFNGNDEDAPDTYRPNCSYCGSMSQTTFFAAIDGGAELGPTDKNYKVYVHGDGFRKFYFQHLDDEGRSRFIALLNERKIKIGVPGHFYVLPYFVQVRD